MHLADLCAIPFPVMGIVSVDQVRAHLQKRSAQDSGHKRKKEAIANKPKVGGSSIRAPSTAARALVPCVTFVPLTIST